MAIADITKPIALDETLQSTNGLLGTQNGKLDSIVTAIMSISLASVGNVNSLTTTDKTSLVGAVNELNAGKVSASSVGVAGGIAELDNTGKVPASQLPAFVDDVIEGYLYNGNFYEDSAHTQLITPEDGKLYVDLVGNRTYRWSGSQYTEVSQSLALGETSTTAYRGDRGKTAYDHSQDANRITTAKAEGLYKIGATAQGHISSATAVTKGDITALGLVGSVTDSTTNGNIVVDGSEVQVYDDTDVTNDITDIEGKLTTDTATSTGNPINFATKTAQNAESTIIDLEPIQDLHGYDKPWVGGAGKNKCPLTISNLKAGTQPAGSSWNGNVYTHQNVTWTFETLEDNDTIIKVIANGTANQQSTLRIDGYYKAGNYIANGLASAGSYSTFHTMVFGTNILSTNGSNVSVAEDGTYTYYCFINAGYNANNVVFYPMIRLSTETDPTFAPYTNNCPISGRTEIGIEGCGVNIWDEEWEMGAIRGTNGTNVDSTTKFRSKNYIPVTPNSSVYFYHPTQTYNPNCSYFFYANDYSFISYADSGNSGVINIPNNCYYIRFSILGTDYENNIAINYPSTVTTYSSYAKSTDLTIQFGETVYGGSLDVEKGVLTVDKVIETFDGSNDETWVIWQAGTGHSFRSNTSQIHVQPADTHSVVASTKTNYLSLSTPASTYSSLVDYSLSLDGDNYRFSICLDSSINTEAKCKAFLANNPLQVCYELPPQVRTTIQLTPHQISLLKGVNNISVSDDYSTITLTYRSGEVAMLGDLKEAIDNLPTGGDYHEYSTQEKVVAKWIDGSIVYERTFWLDSRINIMNDYSTILINDVSEYGIYNIIDFKVYDSNGGQDLTRIRYLTDTISMLISNANQLIVWVANNNSYSMVGYTLRYTKST